jgi:hypothetical protein
MGPGRLSTPRRLAAKPLRMPHERRTDRAAGLGGPDWPKRRHEPSASPPKGDEKAKVREKIKGTISYYLSVTYSP